MNIRLLKVTLLGIVLITINPGSLFAQPDTRNIKSGNVIPDESYSDQPYIVKTNDGAWLCVLTTGKSNEGESGQHVITQRSLDRGKTWTDKADVEPANGPEASYAVLLKAPSGRLFVFYNHNTDNLRSIRGDSPPYKDGIVKRVDSQGYFVFKYSDDNGKTWSTKRFTVPMRNFAIDLENPYQGKIQFFWNVGRPFADKGSAYVPVHKVGGFGEGFFTKSEGALIQSENLLTVKDPSQAKWSTLPDGDVGLRTPANGGGPIAEEQSFTVLSDGSFFCVYRTIDGYSAFTYSRDKGHTWDAPQYMKYANGRLMKHPRAANFVWKCENGKYLYWFHNHGGTFIRESPNRRSMAYNDRNPVWISGGIEDNSPKGKIIRWSQPEILLYDDDPIVRMSYPDLVEDNDSYYITETQKDIAAVNKIDSKLLEILWAQFSNHQKVDDGIVLNWSSAGETFPHSLSSPGVGDFYQRDPKRVDGGGFSTGKGFTIELNFNLKNLSPGQVLLDSRKSGGAGWYVAINDNKTLEISLSDGRSQSVWSSDEGLLSTRRDHQVTIIVDGGPRVISFVVDGLLNDGGATRQFGWGRFNPYLQSVSGAPELTIGSKNSGTIKHVVLYNRALKVSEAIDNYGN